MNQDNEKLSDAMWYVQRSLQGEIHERLRAVVISSEEGFLKIRLYINGEVSDDDYESASRVETEVMADYCGDFSVIATCIRADVPSAIVDDGVWVFRGDE